MSEAGSDIESLTPDEATGGWGGARLESKGSEVSEEGKLIERVVGKQVSSTVEPEAVSADGVAAKSARVSEITS